MSKLVRFHPGTVGARLGGFFARAVGAGTATLHALAQGYEASLYKAQEHQRTRALERRSGMLGISPEWYEAIAEEVGEHTLMEKAADIARAGTTRGRGGVPDWIGLTEDPYEPLTGFGGYRERPAILSYDMLTTLSRRVGPFTGYLQTRMNQLTYYADPQEDKHGPGYVVRKRGGKKEGRGEDKKARKYEEILRASGSLEVYDAKSGTRRPGMLEFLKLFLRDSLVYDQAHIEARRTRGKDLVAWRALSAPSIRQASPDADVINPFGEIVRYVQIVDGVVAAEFSPLDLSFSIRNPRSSLRVFGYGYSELEMMISTVTALLSGFEHNANYFCASGDLRVATRAGLQRIDELAGHRFDIWNGHRWQPATAVETGPRPLVRTKLWNGLELKTSPDHRFRVIPAGTQHSAPGWKEQRALVPGDHLLVAVGGVEAPMDFNLLRVGQVYEGRGSRGREFVPTQELVEDPEFWEMIGFAIGDGYWPRLHEHGNNLAGKRGPQRMLVFPHHTKDAALFGKFLAVCERHGVRAKRQQYNKHVTRADGVAGIPVISIGHSAFLRWLYDLGFKPSTDGKRAADALFQLPIWLRSAVLRGWFSADGCTRTHETGYRTPSLYSEDARLRQDAVLLLWSVGVAVNDVGSGWNRSGDMIVQDTEAFVEKVGYLQDYKNAGITRSPISQTRWDKLHPGVAIAVSEMIAAGPLWLKLSQTDRGMISRTRRGVAGLSRPRAIRMLQEAGAAIPDVLLYHHVPVDVIDTIPICTELMFDVEVFDEEHTFLGNMVAVHNSQGTSAKGVLAISGLVPRAQMRAFRRKWTAMVTGAQNAWRAPILEVTDLEGKGGGLKWIDIQKSNLDMEWSNFMDWLLRVMCSVLQIAPEEIGFQLGNRGQTSTLNEGNQAQKIEASQDRGLRPTLKWAAQQINEHVLWPMDPGYELAFEGLDARSESEEVDLLTKEVAAYLTVDEAREARNLPPMPDKKGEIILSPTYIQSVQNAAMAEQQQSMMGAEGEAGEEGEEGEEGDAPSGGFAGVDGFGGFAAQGGEPAEKSLTGPARLRRLRGQNSVVYEVDL